MKLFGKKIFKGNTLYYPGCLTKFAAKEILEKYKKILQREGIDFVMLGDKEVCCGSPVKNAGAQEQFKKLVENNLEIFKEHGIGRIITNCPACALVFKKDYKEALGEKWDIEALHFTELEPLKSTQKSKSNEVVTYHDPCHLGRALGIYDEPRKMIRNAGYEIDEMELNNFKSFCCGGGGGVKTNDGELSNRVAKDRIEQVKKTKARTVVTPCPMCWAHLKENSGDDIEIKELSEIILDK
ncbi:MAG: (Fe-S)-binding protein [Patescibacteria group bacterium]|nr:(Fe-S)-binding protein [Patescibacteria group bacterium]